MTDAYAAAAAAHAAAGALDAILPPLLAGPVAGLCTAAAFLLIFYLAVAPGARAKSVALEEAVATVGASFFAGVGVVALFTAAGVYV